MAYWVFLVPKPLPERATEANPLAGLDWLPAESGLVAGVNLEAFRQQEWLLQLLDQATSDAGADKDYQEFVTSTGFDYASDLDQLWLGFYGPSDKPFVVGVAEGKFSREKLTGHALRYGGQITEHREFEIYQVDDPIRSDSQQAGSFAFAFLAKNRLAFGSDTERVKLLLDTAAGESTSVGGDEARRARLEKASAGQQLWASNDLSRWTLSYLQKQKDIAALLKELGAGIAISPTGLRLQTVALCHEPEQAERLHDNLKLLLLAGRLYLRGDSNPLVQSLGKSLSDIDLYQEGPVVQAELELTQTQVTALLTPPEENLQKPPAR
jgi:hypothetical protein